MTKTESRKALHAYVSDDAHDHWHDTATEWGVTVSAILEVLAPRLATTINTDTASLATSELESLVVEARRIDATRRRRTRKP